MQQHALFLHMTPRFPAMFGHWLCFHLVHLPGFSVLCFFSVFRAVWICDTPSDPLYYTSRLLYLYDDSFSSRSSRSCSFSVMCSHTAHCDVKGAIISGVVMAIHKQKCAFPTTVVTS